MSDIALLAAVLLVLHIQPRAQLARYMLKPDVFPQHVYRMTGYMAPQPGYAPQPMATTPPTYGGAVVDTGVAPLPPGWEMRMEPDGRMLYIDHNTKACFRCCSLLQVGCVVTFGSC